MHLSRSSAIGKEEVIRPSGSMEIHRALREAAQTIETENVSARGLPRFLQMAIEESAGRIEIAERTEGTKA